jgi:cyclophilin family peptidyl-prolyl cis-trans isomerase
MIASMAAIGLGPGLGSTTSSDPPPFIDDELSPEATPITDVFTAPAPTIDTSVPHVAVVRTNQGEIEIELSTGAPQAVNSFAFLAGKGFYNGTKLFYVTEFFAQGGDPTCHVDSERLCTGLGGPGYTLQVEDSGMDYDRWTVVAPVLSEGVNEVHGSQFRILFEPDTRPGVKGTVFGKVVKGQDILESLPTLVPCSVVNAEDCGLDTSSALVIEDVVVRPA